MRVVTNVETCPGATTQAYVGDREDRCVAVFEGTHDSVCKLASRTRSGQRFQRKVQRSLLPRDASSRTLLCSCRPTSSSSTGTSSTWSPRSSTTVTKAMDLRCDVADDETDSEHSWDVANLFYSEGVVPLVASFSSMSVEAEVFFPR